MKMRMFLGMMMAVGLCGAQNLLENGDFTVQFKRLSSPAGWDMQCSGNCKMEVDKTVTYNGKPSLRIELEGDGAKQWNWVCRSVKGAVNRGAYTISAMVKTEGLKDGALAYLSLNGYDNHGNRVMTNDSQQKLTGTTDWTKITYTVPSMARGVSKVMAHACLYGYGKAWFTNIQVEAGEVATEFHPADADAATVVQTEAMSAAATAWLEKQQWREPKGPNHRIAVLDMGLSATNGEAGHPADVQKVCETLKNLTLLDGAVTESQILSAEELANPEIFNIDHFAMLVVPTGRYFPATAVRTLTDFLQEGGLMVTCGGYAFDKPVIKVDGRWISPAELTKDGLKGTHPLSLPAASWTDAGAKGTPTAIVDCDGPNGTNGVKISTPLMTLYNNAAINLPKDLPQGWSVIHFWAKGDEQTTRAWFELAEQDGARWHIALNLTTEWKEFVLTPSDFNYWHDNPSVGRGGEGDHLKPENAIRLMFGVSADIEKAGMAHDVYIADVKVGIDPLRTLRETPVPHINTRHAHIRDAMWPLPTQINIFDPSFELRHVERIDVCQTAGVFDATRPLKGSWKGASGFSAIGQLGVNGHGFGPNRARWIPLLECFDKDGRSRGHAAAILHHFANVFTGSSWAFFGVDNMDLLADDGERAALLQPIVKALFRRVFLNRTMTGYMCYRRGEDASLQTVVSNFSHKDCSGRVRFVLTAENGAKIVSVESDFNVQNGGETKVEASWKVPQDAPNYIYVKAELLDGDRVVDAETTSVVIWDEAVQAKGVRVKQEGTRLTIGGESRFFMGNQTYWGQNGSVTARSPMHFDQDFKTMREHGLRWSRCFMPFGSEFDKRVSDAVVQLAQKHSIVLYHTPNLGNTADKATLERQKATMAEIAERYKHAPGLAIDICNEQTVKFTSQDYKDMLGQEPKTQGEWNDPDVYKTYQTATKLQRNWAANGAAGAHSVRPEAPVSAGWMQGWGGGNTAMEPLVASLDLDFTDRHYYGNPVNMMPQIKDVDLRVLGKPLLVGECGAKNHPTFKAYDPWGNGDDDESYDYRFRYLVSHAFGMGCTALLSWHWRDPMEGIFPCGLVHSTWVPRPTAALYKRMAETFGKLELVDNPPDTVLLLGDYLRHTALRQQVINAEHRASQTLMWLGANFSVLPDSELGKLPETVKVLIYPVPYVVSDEVFDALKAFVNRGGMLWVSGDISIEKPRSVKEGRLMELCGVKSTKLIPPLMTAEVETTSEMTRTEEKAGINCYIYKENTYFCNKPLELDGGREKQMREWYGMVLQKGGASMTRRSEDSDKLETFRVPGKGATGWVLWNGGAEDVTVSRGGHSITVHPKRIGYLQIADDGALQVKEEL
ncbi:MAG: hypothetical protein IKX30_13790 [Victivallales bacterium]|nr:hypothetical protein [Victivallales bacterium]